MSRMNHTANVQGWSDKPRAMRSEQHFFRKIEELFAPVSLETLRLFGTLAAKSS